MQKTISPIDNQVYIEREYHSHKIEETLNNSVKAQTIWGHLSVKERVELLKKFVEDFLSKKDVIAWAMSDDINREKVRIIYENDEIGIEHSFVTFKDGNTQAVMAVFKFQDGKIISLETGATNMPK